MTRPAPSSSAVKRLRSACSMKSACRNRSRWICMPGRQRALDVVERGLDLRSVSSSVLTFGCFWMPRMTAGLRVVRAFAALDRRAFAHDARGRAPARARRRSLRTATAAMASVSARRPTPRMRYSCPSATWKPAVAFRLAAVSARSTSSSVTACAASCAGSSTTSYCFWSPPVAITCETPGTASSRRRTSVSATVRSSCGECRSDSRSTNSTSPMIDDTGARNGGSHRWAAALRTPARASR